MLFGSIWSLLLLATFSNGQNDTDVIESRPDNIQKVSRKKEIDAKFWSASDSGLQWLTNLYNPHIWNPHHIPGGKHLSGQCRSSMKNYLMALTNGSLWAAKMSDASGRYASQFFFGNDFWLGSQKQCAEISTIAPFPVFFHIVKFAIVLDPEFTPLPREVSLGVCLPEPCSADDINNMVTAASIPPPDSNHSLTLLRVRPVPGNYSLFADPKLHIMAAVTILVIILMIIGTFYEWTLERRNSKHRVQRSNNNETSKEKINFEKEELSKSEADLVASLDPCRGMGKFAEIVLSFSILSNGRKILECGVAPKDSLTCVHGLRFFSLSWVILVHTYLQVFIIAENKKMRTLAEENFMFQTVANATFSVDTFFFISGLLVAYLFFKSSSKPDRDPAIRTPRPPRPLGLEIKIMISKFFTLLGYRFLRLTPAYLYVLGGAEIAMRWLKNITVFEPVSNDNVNCAKYWWRNALYVNSLYPRSEMCMLWSWYLSNDTQFYVVGILVLLISARVAVASMFFLLISSSVTTAMISLYYNHVVSVQQPFIFFDELYDKPWTRLGPYLVGMFTGWFIHRTKSSLKMSRKVTLFGWCASLLTLIGLVYGVKDAGLDVTGTAIYVGIGHALWGVALGWIVIACTSGHGGCVNGLLSCRLLQPLSRLTYCAYLVHPVIMVLTSFQMDGPLHLHNNVTLMIYFGNLVAAFIVSFFLSLAFEAPVVRLLKVLLTPLMTRQNR